MGTIWNVGTCTLQVQARWYRQDGAFCNDPSLYVRLNVYIYTHMYIDWLWACEMCECGAMLFVLFACSLQKMSTYHCVCDYLQIYVCMYICHVKCEGLILSLLTDVTLVLHGPAHYMG